MKKLRRPGMAQNPCVNARRGAIIAGSGSRVALPGKGSCLCCYKNFAIIRPRQKFCSNRCRLLYWAAREIQREYSVGNASGLRDVFEKLKP
jgi:hypothetical protein